MANSPLGTKDRPYRASLSGINGESSASITAGDAVCFSADGTRLVLPASLAAATAPGLFAGIAVVLLTSMLMGAGVSFFTGASFATGFLSTAPGGLTEMGITALIVGADISTMTAYQLVRLLFIMLVFPYIAKGIVYLYRKNTATPFR